MSTLEWVKQRELPSGGLEGIQGSGKAYPEITGYSIPTLIAYGEVDFAVRLAEWLVSIQNKDGSWSGMDKTKYTFDTAAIIQGLVEAQKIAGFNGIADAITKAMAWINSMKDARGFYKISNYDSNNAMYLGRVAWIMKDHYAMTLHIPTSAFPSSWGEKPRVHYIAYLLEGLWNMGFKREVREILETAKRCLRPDSLFPSKVSHMWLSEGHSDTCATCQMAILYLLAGDRRTAEELVVPIQSMIQPDGGLWMSHDCHDKPTWTAKYYLDLIRIL